jgi:hypothetical protein
MSAIGSALKRPYRPRVPMPRADQELHPENDEPHGGKRTEEDAKLEFVPARKEEARTGEHESGRSRCCTEHPHPDHLGLCGSQYGARAPKKQAEQLGGRPDVASAHATARDLLVGVSGPRREREDRLHGASNDQHRYEPHRKSNRDDNRCHHLQVLPSSRRALYGHLADDYFTINGTLRPELEVALLDAKQLADLATQLFARKLYDFRVAEMEER